MAHARLTALVTLLILSACAHAASAQTSPGILPLRLGQTVWVTTSEGRDMKGVVSGITPTTLEVSGEAGTKQFVVAETRRIAKRDGNRNGFLIGAGVGALPYLIGAVSGETCFDDEPCGPGFYVALTLMSGALWGGVGALIDNAIEGRTTIYERSMPVVQLAPLVSRSGFGLRGSIRW